MKRLFVLASLACAFATPASALTFKSWQGNVFVAKASTACKAIGWSAGNYANAVLRPKGIANNGSFTAFSIFTPRTARRFSIANKGFVTGFYGGKIFFSSGGFAEWDGTGGTLHSKLIVKVSPTVVPTHKTLTTAVTITNFDNTANCTVTLVGALYLRP